MLLPSPRHFLPVNSPSPVSSGPTAPWPLLSLCICLLRCGTFCLASLTEHLVLTVQPRVSRRGTSSFFPRPQSCSVLWTGPVWHVCPSLMSTWLVSISGCRECLCGCLSPCFHSSGCSPGRGLPSRRVILCVTLRNNWTVFP